MLVVTSGNWWVLVTAFIAGAVGGLAAALILLDPTESTSSPPTGAKAWAVVGIRTLVGAVAATAFLFFFPTEQQTTVIAANKTAVTTTVYPFLKVIALALVVGTGGSAFLSSMRNQAMSFVTASNANQAKAAIKATSVTALSLLPNVAGQAAKAEAAHQVQAVENAANTQITLAAEGLPPQLDIAGVDPTATVRTRFAEVLGTTPDRILSADASAGAAALSEAVSPIPQAVESAVSSTMQDEIASIINQIKDI